jgi:hypothetical protein
MPAELHGVWGFTGTAGPSLANYYTPTLQTPVSGNGTAATPLRQETTYSIFPLGASHEQVWITQSTSYVNGSQEFRVRWDVKNASGQTLTFKALVAADFFFEGDDAGVGIFTAGPPRFLGGTNVDSGSSGGFVEVAPAWSAYQALAYGPFSDQVWGKIGAAADAATATFDNTVVATPVDNAGGIEWDNVQLMANETKAFELLIRSAVPSSLQLNPTNAASRQGVPVGITATATDSVGQPYSGKTLRYTITGPNATTGAATIGPAGTAVVTDPGTNAGTDTVTVYVDFNNSGTREALEPQASALATFVDSIPPTCTVKASGTLIGGGASGKPLVITVNCGEGATVTLSASLRLPALRTTGYAFSSLDKKKKPKPKPKPRNVRLATKMVTVQPGTAAPIRIAIPRSIARKYAGRTLKATMVVTAKDTTGNVSKLTTTRNIKLAKIKPKPKPKKKKKG